MQSGPLIQIDICQPVPRTVSHDSYSSGHLSKLSQPLQTFGEAYHLLNVNYFCKILPINRTLISLYWAKGRKFCEYHTFPQLNSQNVSIDISHFPSTIHLDIHTHPITAKAPQKSA